MGSHMNHGAEAFWTQSATHSIYPHITQRLQAAALRADGLLLEVGAQLQVTGGGLPLGLGVGLGGGGEKEKALRKLQ